MAGPPEDKSASDLVRTLLEPAPSEAFLFRRRGNDGEVRETPIRVRVLRLDETHAAIIAAQEYAKARGESKEYTDVYREGQAIEILQRCICKPDLQTRERPDGSEYGAAHYPPMFLNAKQLRESFTPSEMAQCLNLYEIVQARYGNLETLDKHEIDQWISKLADGFRTGAYFLSQLDSTELPALCLALAARAAELASLSGLTLPDWRPSSESPQSGSNGDTTSSSGEPSTPSEIVMGSEQIDLPPPGEVLTKADAQKRSKRLFPKP